MCQRINRLTFSLESGTHAAVHAGRVRQHQSVDALIGGNEDEYIVEGLLDVYPTRQDRTVGEPEFDSIVEQVGVQRLFHQLNTVS